METPAKIYLPKEIDTPSAAILVYGKQEGDAEYIRKDVLLAWAKETYLNENASNIRKVCFKQLVEKLESL